MDGSRTRRQLLSYIFSGICVTALLPTRANAAYKVNTSVSVLDYLENEVRRNAVRRGSALFDMSVYINRAIIDAKKLGITTVRLPAGTYMLSGERKGPYRAMVGLRSNLRLVGDGARTKLKVADHYTSGGEYRLFGPLDDGAIDNLAIENICFDGNAFKNLVNTSKGADIRGAYVLFVRKGSNILVQNCHFVNQPGRSIVNMGGNENRNKLRNVTIRLNRFTNVGGAVQGNRMQNDHSSIYLQADGGVVDGNIFENSQVVDHFGAVNTTVTALEIHGSNTRVTNNHVKNYTNGGNAVSTVMDSINNVWSDNVFENLTSFGLAIFSRDPFITQNLQILRNRFSVATDQARGNTVIYQGPAKDWTSSAIRQLKIDNNIIIGVSTRSIKSTWHGISIVAVDGGVISNNKIRNIQGCGINVEDADVLLPVRNIKIVDNDIVNAGLHSPKNRIWGIRVASRKGRGNINNVSIIGNKIDNDGSAPNMRGVMVDAGSADVSEVQVQSNVITRVPPSFKLQRRSIFDPR